ncbi:unnamed protein product [Toxocara canis]|uniref:Cytochrome P450 n=1 Tax=Toxocara canis TaxID=6265 RepID=A0A183UXS5_TOXCA|nr:unnamed protein product [Toxocara canis]
MLKHVAFRKEFLFGLCRIEYGTIVAWIFVAIEEWRRQDEGERFVGDPHIETGLQELLANHIYALFPLGACMTSAATAAKTVANQCLREGEEINGLMSNAYWKHVWPSSEVLGMQSQFR